MSKLEKYISTSLKVGCARLIALSSGVKYTCIYCKLEFPCEGSIFVHLTTLKHMGLPNSKFQQNPNFECNICGTDLNVASVTKHLCVEKAYKNYFLIIKHIDEFGCPNMCLLCRGKIFETPAHLNIHMLIKHNWNEFNNDEKVSNNAEESKKIKGLKCPLCHAVFKTNDMTVLHFHAFEDHLAEIGIPLIISFSGFRRVKYGSENDMKQWLTKYVYSCHFPYPLVKRFPISKCENINRSLPAFNLLNCNMNFLSLINLTSHLCSHHFLDGINMKDHKGRLSTSTMNNKESDMRINMIQKELDLKNRNLIERNIITNKIPASEYCLECFKIFRSNYELQIHYLVSHSNFEWNICGICGYDCKFSLSINDYDTSLPKRTNNLLWRALRIHEENHVKFFKKLGQNPEIEILNNLLPDFSNNLKTILTPFKPIMFGESVELEQPKVQLSNFTVKEKSHLLFLGHENKKAQTELIIIESLNN